MWTIIYCLAWNGDGEVGTWAWAPVAVFLVSPSPAWEQAACDFTELL